jgi:hypothetical protein
MSKTIILVPAFGPGIDFWFFEDDYDYRPAHGKLLSQDKVSIKDKKSAIKRLWGRISHPDYGSCYPDPEKYRRDLIEAFRSWCKNNGFGGLIPNG